MVHRWRPADTDPEVWERQVEHWRAMTVEERCRFIKRMHDDLTSLMIAGIRADRPGIDDDKLRYELARRRYGDELANEVFGRAPS